jgi:lactate dehydrogenase-like 2-hydroxyacid dehydrogenase
VGGFEVLLAEGGNRTNYPGELDWEDYCRFFTPSLEWVQLCSTGFSDNITPQVLDGTVTLTNAPGLHTNPIAESVLAAMLDHA